MSDQKKDDAPTLSTQEQVISLLGRLTDIQERQPIPQQTVAQATFVTPWNPTGKKNRLKLKRTVFYNGHQLSDAKLTEEEIELFNGLRPGRYKNRLWTVIEKDAEGTSALHVYIPNKTEAQRIETARMAPNGIADLLKMIHAEQQKPKVA